MERKAAGILRIREEILNLTNSPLYELRVSNNYQPVVGAGSLDAKIMLIGEAPGENEAKTGIPFCGRSGQVLDKLLVAAGMSREEIYISNLVNDRPPKNRDPKPEEVALYSPFLSRQIQIIKPKVIATLGRFAMSFIYEKITGEICKKTISELHGQEIKGEMDGEMIIMMPLYHPAVAVYNGKRFPELLEDFKKMKFIIS